jgi:serine/threonine-protein kinase
LVGKDGVARLTDFGVARAEARISSTETGRLKGKMAYMPPELLLGSSADCRSDLYSAALVLWEALTGKRLFRADSEGELIHQILSGKAPWPHKIDPGVPLGIASVCMRAMAREPDDRYATADEFADALESAARDSAIEIAKPRRVGSFVRDLMPRLDDQPPSQAGASTTPGSVKSAAPLVSYPPIRVDADDASNPVQSGLTNAAAILSMAPPRSRRGLIALALIACVFVGAGSAVLLMMRSEAAPAAPGPPETPVANDKPAAEPDPPIDESEPPPPAPKPSVAPSNPAVPRPVPPTPVKRFPPTPPQPTPKTSPTNFRPDGL